jgi:glutaredoxin
MKPVLYVKQGCPWCVAALDFFKANNLHLDVRDVLADASAMRRLREISGQNKCPTIELEDFLVTDFSVEEFRAALAHAPEAIRRQLPLAA